MAVVLVAAVEPEPPGAMEDKHQLVTVVALEEQDSFH
jgi:hypothetical protein